MQSLARAFVIAMAVASGAQTTACRTTADHVVLTNKTLEAGCGTCRYHLPDGQGCYWVIEHEGQHYPVAGTLPTDHENHAPDGMCNMTRSVSVTGEIRGKNFIAGKFEVLSPADVPAKPEFTPQDVH